MGKTISRWFGGRPDIPNQTEARRAKREKDAKDAAQKRARAHQEERKRIRAQIAEAVQAAQEALARRAEELGEAAARAAQGFAREAQQERERTQRMCEDAERAMAAAREAAERAQQAADEQRRQAEAGKALAEEMEARKVNEAKKEAEESLKKGIQPIVTPTLEEVAAAKRRIQYREDCFHFAVAGTPGSDKSSLVNALRGLRSKDADAAAVGVTETTLRTTRYQDANPDNPYVWYDVPGAGAFKRCDWRYFNDQGLYVFDSIIVLFDDCFTMTDVAILTNAKRFNIPTYIVHSKADQHIRNIMIEMGYDSDGDDKEDVERRNKLYKAARTQFVDRTRKSVQTNLESVNLTDQRVYIVSSNTLLKVVLRKPLKKAIDEVDLFNDLINVAYGRRKRGYAIV